jgi:hypothetical protein
LIYQQKNRSAPTFQNPCSGGGHDPRGLFRGSWMSHPG